ncbi:MAG: AAA family ATPase [Chloroflexota bacterium]
MAIIELQASELRRETDLRAHRWKSSREVEPLDGLVGQERAVRAVAFGVKVRGRGYNIFMSGPTGTGKTTYARSALRRVAAEQPVPQDICCVYNFSDPDRPRIIELPQGQGEVLARDLDRLIAEFREEIPKAFTGEEYDRRRKRATERFDAAMQQALHALTARAERAGFALARNEAGEMTPVPVRDGKPLPEEEFARLPEAEQKRYMAAAHELSEELQDLQRRYREIAREARAALRQVDEETARLVVEPHLSDLARMFDGNQRVQEYLTAVGRDILAHLEDFRLSEDDGQNPVAALMPKPQPNFTRYRVNVLVTHRGATGAPVVFETNPTYYNLFGQITYKSVMGALVTDHTMIKAGAIHRASGGYLIVHAAPLLQSPFAWEGLKRALTNRQAKIENIGEHERLVPMSTLAPEPIPIDVKVIMIGYPLIYALLHQHDEEFKKLFKVKADFATEMDRIPEAEQSYAAFVASVCDEAGLRPFDRDAIGRIIDFGARLAEHQNKLSTRFSDIVAVINEASAWADVNGHDQVAAADVIKALEERRFRSNLVEERLLEMMDEGTILIATDGAVTGQVNGIAVLSMGDIAFGRPSRITARTFIGRKGIVNIERETHLSGSIHDKGVFILSGYLGGKFARDIPLALSASIAFEQGYEEVDGDSASSAETYALLSALANVPLRQDIAVTGSVNQHGEIQPIGGVNEKIEGFFAVCKLRGLTGRQGVVIPHQNVVNLMLKDEVVAAVRDGRFHIWAVHTIDEGIELLTGVPAGVYDDTTGTYPPESVNGRVAATLRRMAAVAQPAFASEEESPAGTVNSGSTPANWRQFEPGGDSL